MKVRDRTSLQADSLCLGFRRGYCKRWKGRCWSGRNREFTLIGRLSGAAGTSSDRNRWFGKCRIRWKVGKEVGDHIFEQDDRTICFVPEDSEIKASCMNPFVDAIPGQPEDPGQFGDGDPLAGEKVRTQRSRARKIMN